MNTVLLTLTDLVTVLAQIVPEYSPDMLPLTDTEQNNLPFIAVGTVCLAIVVAGLVKMRRRRHKRHLTDR